MSMFRSVTIAFAGVLAGACQPGPSAMPGTEAQSVQDARPSVERPSTVAQAASKDGRGMHVLESFIATGQRMLDSTSGPLLGAGSAGVVLVTEPSQPSTAPGADLQGRGVLLVDVGAGGPVMLGRNDRIVPCSTCGGIAGDPYADTEVGDGRFTLFIEGGSRERWSHAYTFVHEPAARRFVLERATRRVVDTLTGAEAHSDLDPQDFGVITFEAFDPEQLGDAPTLPAG